MNIVRDETFEVPAGPVLTRSNRAADQPFQPLVAIDELELPEDASLKGETDIAADLGAAGAHPVEHDARFSHFARRKSSGKRTDAPARVYVWCLGFASCERPAHRRRARCHAHQQRQDCQ